MTKPEALQLLAQIAQDFLNTLPPSARLPLQQKAQEAISALQQQELAPAP